MTPSPRFDEFLKWVVAALLAAMLVDVVVVAYRIPVKRYIVTCEKSQMISCELQRETSADHQTWQGTLGPHAVARVKIQPVRRGAARVLLDLDSGSQAFFAAEFEGGAAGAHAEAAASELNHVFSSAVPASVRVVARPPTYLAWMMWGGIGFLGMIVLVIYRELFRPRLRSDNSSKLQPSRGAA